MNIFQKIVGFIVGFSGLFYFVRTNDFYNSKILIADLGGIPWLYSTIGLIFSIIAAFAIQKEWDNWNNLVEAVENEINALEELWIWTDHLPSDISKKINGLIIEYLKVVIREGWQKSEHGERSDEAEHVLSFIRKTISYDLKVNFKFNDNFFVLFGNIIRERKSRLRFSTRHMPNVLHYTLILSTSLLVFLSLLVGIKNIWLDYIFTLSIATLVYTVYQVIFDLDQPLRPGGWHLTTKNYNILLQRIEANHKQS